MSRIILAIDFDGTIAEHRFPQIGVPVPGAFEWMKKFQEAGALLILLTMRSDRGDSGGNYLADAIEFCRKHGVEFWAHNTNPEQETWTGSRKVYAHAYVDDAAVGCPLKPTSKGDGLMVDWEEVGPIVMNMIEARRRAFGASST